MTKDSRKQIMNAVFIGLALNILLAGIKLGFGYYGGSQALISDGYNSFSDVFMSIIIFFVIRIATKKPDENHPYGHQKFEGILYFTLGIVFLITAILLGYQAVSSIIKNDMSVSAPLRITVYISAVALAIKIFLAYFYFKLNKTFHNPTLKAEAKNHFIDGWSTGATLIGLILTQFGFVIFDAIAALIVALFILRLAIQILIEAVSYLVDEAPVKDLLDDIRVAILDIYGVLSIDDLKVRRHMTEYYVDVEIGVDQNLSLVKAHQIAETVHIGVEKQFPDVIHCMVHVNPFIARKNDNK